MTQYIKNAVDWYYDIMDNKSDPRVNGWWMMSGPLPTIVVSLCYVLFVTKIGPRLMQNRKPLKLKRVLIVYNAFLVAISIYFFHQGSVLGWFTTYSYTCEPVDYSDNPIALQIVRSCWLFYMSKFLELCDTIFFVLRKKFDHISTLHVFHHGIMPISVWIGVKFIPGGHYTFFGFVNSGVHIVMYTYYMLAAMGPSVQPYLWWKKYLTTLQIAQFVLVLAHSLLSVFVECDQVKTYGYVIAAYCVIFLVLFINFYRLKYSDDKIIETNGNFSSSKLPGVSFTHQAALYDTSASNELHSKKIS